MTSSSSTSTPRRRAPVIERLVNQGGDIVVRFDGGFASDVESEQAEIRSYKVYYGLSDDAVSGDATGGAFLENGPSLLLVGLEHEVRLIGAPLGQPLFVAVSAVDHAGNESARSIVASIDVEREETEVISSFDARRTGIFRGLWRYGLNDRGNGFEVVDLAPDVAAGEEVVLEHVFDPITPGLTMPGAGAPFVAAGPAGRSSAHRLRRRA